jgi:diguanylate cyclase (GGDEF)-like protein
MRSERSTDAHRTLAARALELEQQSHRDPLTGLPNGAWFDGQLAQWFGEARETGTALTLLVADIDRLHALNQAHGHGAGDKVIFSVAACLKRRLRPRDLLARQAGASFAVLLPRASSDAGRVVAERLRAGVAESGHDIAVAQTLRVTISVGCVTVLPAGRGPLGTRQQLLETAARALAAAKRDGGDRAAFLVENRGEPLDRSPPRV